MPLPSCRAQSTAAVWPASAASCLSRSPSRRPSSFCRRRRLWTSSTSTPWQLTSRQSSTCASSVSSARRQSWSASLHSRTGGHWAADSTRTPARCSRQWPASPTRSLRPTRQRASSRWPATSWWRATSTWTARSPATRRSMRESGTATWWWSSLSSRTRSSATRASSATSCRTSSACARRAACRWRTPLRCSSIAPLRACRSSSPPRWTSS
mmetsp:Transcript_13786/g.54524  ORF Transcript_13786/g.54524 Transcript_13786/m.54524 type:complete len:211 (-) Transcript_13786:386-1018(-)